MEVLDMPKEIVLLGRFTQGADGADGAGDFTKAWWSISWTHRF